MCPLEYCPTPKGFLLTGKIVLSPIFAFAPVFLLSIPRNRRQSLNRRRLIRDAEHGVSIHSQVDIRMPRQRLRRLG